MSYVRQSSCFYKLGSALTHGNGAESAVAGMAVRTEYHLSAASKALAHYRVNDSLMCGNVDSAVLLCGGETENMVVLVYCSADGAEAVMTVCEHVGYRGTSSGRSRVPSE